MLKLFIEASDGAPLEQTKLLLQSIVGENGILQQQTQNSALDALVASLRTLKGKEPSQYVFDFLDNSILRLVRKPIKYVDELKSLEERASSDDHTGDFSPISLLIITMMEQWPFAAKASNGSVAEVASWVATYLGYSAQIGESTGKIKTFLDRIIGSSVDKDHIGTLTHAFEQSKKVALPSSISSQKHGEEPSLDSGKSERNLDETTSADDLDEVYARPLREDNHLGLQNWVRKDVQDAIEDGDAGNLMMCLCSEHLHIRKEGLINLRKFMAKAEVSKSVITNLPLAC